MNPDKPLDQLLAEYYEDLLVELGHARLRAVGVRVDDQVKMQGRNSSGVRRAAVEVDLAEG